MFEDLPGRYVIEVRRIVHRPPLRTEDGSLLLVSTTTTSHWVRGNFIGDLKCPIYPDSQYVAGLREWAQGRVALGLPWR
jgi:hypothetical protein